MILFGLVVLSIHVLAAGASLLNLADTTIISDDVSINGAVMSGNLRGDTRRTGRPEEEKCPKYKLDYDIQLFHSKKGNHERVPRLKDIRKAYPLEEFTPHEKVTECANDGSGQKLTDEFCKNFAERGGCFGLIREAEKNFQDIRNLGDDWKRRDITNGSYSQALFMSSYCRRACKRKYQDVDIEDLPPQNQWLGGFEDYVVEPFGQRLNICDVSQGWTAYAVYRALETLIMAAVQSPLAPALHPVGFEKTKIPRAIYAQILSARKRLMREKKYEIESCDIGMHNCARVVVSNVSQECHLVSNENYKFLKIDLKTSESVFEQLKDLAEKWIGNRIELIGTAVYGLRKYTRGAYLLSHLDHLETHVVSAILNIAQDVDEDWPLQIMDHDGNHHEVILAPGEMVWYESAKLVHARIKPLVGKYFENMFVHYMPRSLQWYSSDSSLTHEPVKKITLADLEASEKQFKENRQSLLDQRAEEARKKKEYYDKLTTEEKLQYLAEH